MVFERIPSLAKFHKAFRKLVFLETALIYLTFFFGAFLLVLLTVQTSTSVFLRRILLISFSATSLAGLALLVYRARRRTTLDALCRELRAKSSVFRDILSGFEFSTRDLREGVSEDLARAAVKGVEENLEREKPEAWFSRSVLKAHARRLALAVSVLGMTAVFPPYLFQSGWSRLLYGLDREISRHLKIAPEGGKVPLGATVTVTVEILDSSPSVPRLWVKSGAEWQEALAGGGPFRYRFELANIVEPTSYKAAWKDLESRVFTLVPMDIPRLSDFSVTLRFPSYTGEKPLTMRAEPQIHAYRGTEVEIAARATKDLESAEILSREGLRYPVNISGARSVRAAFKIHNPMEFWFVLKDEEGIVPAEPIRYSVTVKEDEVPRVQILAPSEDLWVGQEAVIPFTCELRDDLGVQEVHLNVESQKQGSSQRILLKRYDPAPKQKIDELSYGLSDLRPRPGEVLRLRLEARDNDTVTGPKSGFSDWVTVEVRSYEKEHEAIEKDLSKFRDDLLDLLADQTDASVSKQSLEEAAAAQAKAGAKAKKIGEDMGGILDKMEKDPLSDFSSWSEHKALKEGLEQVREGAMDRAQKALDSKNAPAASAAQAEASSQLERLSHLSEEVQKSAKMRDLAQSADRLEGKSRKLAQKLSEDSRLTPELSDEVRGIMKEAFDILQEIAKAIRDLPEELPEEFVNRPAVKDMNLGQLADSLADLGRSLERGDLQSALKIAQDLVKQAKAAREALAKAAQETSMDLDKSLAEKNSESDQRVDGLVERQEDLSRRTRPFETKRKERYFQEQKKTLEELSARQARVIRDARPLPSAAPAIPKMEKVLKELENKNVIFSQKWLEEITAMDISTGVINSEKEILSALKNPPAQNDGSFSPEDREAMERLGEEQKQLASETGKLAGEISKMGASSALVKPETVESIQSAAKEMESATQSLGKGDSGAAVPSQERALSNLRKGQGMMQEMGQSLSQMKERRGQSQAGMIQPKGGGGSSGMRHGAVRIPGAGDYLPPKEFREEILESLKEKYPESQGGLIKDYFKRLTR